MDQSTIKLTGPYFYLAGNAASDFRGKPDETVALVRDLRAPPFPAGTGIGDGSRQRLFRLRRFSALGDLRVWGGALRGILANPIHGIGSAAGFERRAASVHQGRWHRPALVPRGCNRPSGCEGAELETGGLGNPSRVWGVAGLVGILEQRGGAA